MLNTDIPYTVQDIDRLIELINLERQSIEQGSRQVFALRDFLSVRKYSGIFEREKSTDDRRKRFLAYLEGDFYREYRILFELPLDDMPLWINNEDLGVLARFRLEVAK